MKHKPKESLPAPSLTGLFSPQNSVPLLDIPFQEHEVDWTNEKIACFWKYYNDRDSLDELCFSHQSGAEVIRLVKKFISVNGMILDYGSGKGFLTEHLLEKTCGTISGCDFSADLVETVNRKFSGRKNFNGCITCTTIPTPFLGESFDIIFLLEVIEHLPDRYLETTLEELRRLLKPGGTLVVTTRNEENIQAAKVLCPDCGAIFHKIQHVRSFSRETLVQTLLRNGFRTICCKALNLADYKPGVKFLIRRIMRKIFSLETYLPNLLFIGSKSTKISNY